MLYQAIKKPILQRVWVIIYPNRLSRRNCIGYWNSGATPVALLKSLVPKASTFEFLDNGGIDTARALHNLMNNEALYRRLLERFLRGSAPHFLKIQLSQQYETQRSSNKAKKKRIADLTEISGNSARSCQENVLANGDTMPHCSLNYAARAPYQFHRCAKIQTYWLWVPDFQRGDRVWPACSST